MYQETYTRNEMKQLFEWFEQHHDQLPATMQIDKANYTANLPRTVTALIQALSGREVTPIISGQAYILHLIKENIENGSGEKKD